MSLLLQICGVILPNLQHWNSHFSILCNYFSSSNLLCASQRLSSLNLPSEFLQFVPVSQKPHRDGPFLSTLLLEAYPPPPSPWLSKPVPLPSSGQPVAASRFFLPWQIDGQGTSAGAGWSQTSVNPVTPLGIPDWRGAGGPSAICLTANTSFSSHSFDWPAGAASVRRTLKSGLTPEEARALGLVGTSELQLWCPWVL